MVYGFLFGEQGGCKQCASSQQYGLWLGESKEEKHWLQRELLIPPLTKSHYIHARYSVSQGGLIFGQGWVIKSALKRTASKLSLKISWSIECSAVPVLRKHGYLRFAFSRHILFLWRGTRWIHLLVFRDHVEWKICIIPLRTRILFHSRKEDVQPWEASRDVEIEGLTELSLPFTLTPRHTLTEGKCG